MNHNKKAFNLQEQIILKDVKNTSTNYFHSLITQPDLIEVLKQDLPAHRHRIYTLKGHLAHLHEHCQCFYLRL